MTERGLARLFVDYNARYFGGRLPRYRVAFRWGIPGSEHGGEGYHDRKGRTILLCAGMRNRRDEVAATLLHEMAHFTAGGYHGGRFWREIVRLEQAGAPVHERGVIHSQHVPKRDVPRALRAKTGDGQKRKTKGGGR